MHRYRIWVSIGITWLILGWWGPAQETNENVQEEPFAPVIEKPRAPIIKKMDAPVLETTNTPALEKPGPPIFKKIGTPILKKRDNSLLKKSDAPDQEEREADVQEELDAAAQEPQSLLPIPPGFSRIASDSESKSTEQMMRIKFEAMDLDEILKLYSEWTGLALMKAPNVPAAKITLKCPKRLPKREALLAIESVLAMNGIALVPMGDTFLKVVPIASARQDGMAIDTGELDKQVEDTDHLVSQIVELKHIDIASAQTTIQSLLHSYGKIMPLEQVNCMLITDSALNLKRILEILKYLDQPMEIREELRIFHIAYAKASEIQSKIEAIIADSQARDTKTGFIRQQLSAARLPTKPLVPRRPGQPRQTTTTQPSVVEVSEPSERGLVQAKVKIVADDRTNSLIIITRPDQFQFLENMIKALDKQVEPDVTIKVFRLQYASATDVVSVLNSLISAAAPSATSPVPPVPTAPATEKPAKPSEEIQISGRLTADVKIIADTRINAMLIMASKSDMKVVEDVIAKIDIMLSQVLIEVVIVEIGLSDEIQSGIDWLQRSMIAYNQKQSGEKRAFLSFAGTSKEGVSGEIKDATAISTIGDISAATGSGLTYYFTFFDYNLDAVINMLAQNTEARLLSTPIILTTDNTEARIMVGEKRPIVTSTSITSGGTQQSAYEYTDIGIELKVTPHINKRGFVVMDIEQKIDNVGDYELIDGNKVPVITTREFGASLSVDDGRTIVVGGLMSSDKMLSNTRIPFLGDIPFLGRLFRTDYSDKTRRELLVLITPYVLDTPGKVYEETQRRRAAIDEAKELVIRGWGESELLKSEPEEEESVEESPEKEEKQKNGKEAPIPTITPQPDKT